MLEQMIDLFFFVLFIVCFFFPYVYLGIRVDAAFKKKRYWFILVVITTIFLKIELLLINPIILVFYYVILHYISKKKQLESLFLSFYLALSYHGVRLLFTAMIGYFVTTEQLSDRISGLISAGINIGVLGLVVLLLRGLKLNLDLLFSRPFRPLLKESTLFFGFLYLIRIFLVVLLNQKNSWASHFDTTISLLLFMIYLLWTLHIKGELADYVHEQIVHQKEAENQAMHRMVEKLGSLYDEIRGFRHDFAGIIASMEPAIEKEDIKEIEKIYYKVFVKTNDKLKKADYTAFNLQNIEDIAFRNALAQIMVQAENEGIQFDLQTIGCVPRVHVPMLETVRILSILLNNALEAAICAKVPRVSVALFREKESVIFVVENTRKSGPLDQRRLWESGYSTKAEKRGIGLAVLQELVLRYHLGIETEIGEETFVQKMTFVVREEANESASIGG